MKREVNRSTVNKHLDVSRILASQKPVFVKVPLFSAFLRLRLICFDVFYTMPERKTSEIIDDSGST
uniref:Uncharacterized protein n=1 Tax=Romanomermis culicivorax TaxID=13658 RepID=A0A915K433_ROMCU